MSGDLKSRAQERGALAVPTCSSPDRTYSRVLAGLLIEHTGATGAAGDARAHYRPPSRVITPQQSGISAIKRARPGQRSQFLIKLKLRGENII